MIVIRKIASKFDRLLALGLCKKVLRLSQATGVVSFTFDDAPKSSCTIGRQILENHGCRGTWYIAGGLTDKEEAGHICHSASDLLALHDAGHHIGCHTFSHRRCSGITASAMQDEIAQNAAFLSSLGLPSNSLHFAFPFGGFDFAAKQIAAKCFISTRITGGGAQFVKADLNALRTQSLYQRTISADQIRNIIEKVSSQKGWLIFYSHDIDRQPSPWGCTPELLEMAITTSLALGCKVLPIDQAIDYWNESRR